MMNPTAGCLTYLCIVVMVMLSVEAISSPRTLHQHRVSGCKPREITVLTRKDISNTLTSFDAANGKDLPSWPPGFPALHIPEEPSPTGYRAQCGLLFMTEALEDVLADQRDDLNPDDTALHRQLRDCITTVTRLSLCVKKTLGWTCSPRPPPPKMPHAPFKRKQWSHSVLVASIDFLSYIISVLS